ncbi:MAG TPA: sigma-70 family RNA polymerase sigma factor [Acidimicrobiales bacterium]|nr:sigma-70 family RNA polymerase sigma factor [Acidimicrobiales bacterium]
MAPDDAAVIADSIGDPAGFAAIFERHFGLVYRYCARRIGPEAAEDAAGEVLCRAFEHRGRYDTSRPDAAPWLLGIARNVVADHLRASGRRTDAYARAAWRQGRPEANEPDGGREDELALVAEAVRHLPPGELEPLLLFAWEELSYADIALALAIPVGTVRSRLNRARRRLRRALEGGEGRRAASWATTEGSGDG